MSLYLRDSYGLFGKFILEPTFGFCFRSSMSIVDTGNTYNHKSHSWMNTDNFCTEKRCGKNLRSSNMMAFPSSLLTLRVLLVMQGILQAFVFVLWIDCPPIGLEINNCRIAIYVPGGSFQPMGGPLCLPSFATRSGKTL